MAFPIQTMGCNEVLITCDSTNNNIVNNNYFIGSNNIIISNDYYNYLQNTIKITIIISVFELYFQHRNF